jgi:hypothetical protein
VPELNGRELLHEWRRLMDSVIASTAGRPELPRDLQAAMRRQLELVADVVERERRMQGDLTGRLLAPLDAVFDLLAETGAALRGQAEALEAAGHALEETARLTKRQAELFERTIGALRQPAEFAKAATGSKRPAKKRPAKKSASGTPRRAKPKPRA